MTVNDNKIVNAWFVKKRDIPKEKEMDAETVDYLAY